MIDAIENSAYAIWVRESPSIWAFTTILSLHAMGLAIIASMVLLGIAVRTIPVGTGYAVWTGIGAVGTATLGIILLGEPVTAWRVAFLAMIVCGIAGLKFTAP